MDIYELSIDGGVKRIERLPDGVRLVCAFGCFDGVHVGHQALLSTAVQVSEARGSVEKSFAPAVWTFSEPISKPWLFSVEERLSLCGRLGIKYALCQRFEDVRTLSPEEFIDGLVSNYGLVSGVCGENFRFGYKGAGDPVCLEKSICGSLARFGVPIDDGVKAVNVVGDVLALGGVVSSTRIRALLAQGDVESVECLLGRPYSLAGTVKAGKQIGRTMSRPTVNLSFAHGQLIPKRGVYFTYCRVGERIYRGVTNVGYRPTVNSDVDSVTCETHLLDFSESIYGERIEIIFVHYHRVEMTFGSTDALSRQITEDVTAATVFFDKRENG